MGFRITGGSFDTEASGLLDHDHLGGLEDDDHLQYVLVSGRAGGQSVFGGTNANDDFYFGTTTHGTKGFFFFGDSAFDETNNRLGLGTLVPTHTLTFAEGNSWTHYNTADQTTNYQRLTASWAGNRARILTESAGSLSSSIPDFDIGNSNTFLRLHGSSGGGFVDIGGASGGFGSFVCLSDGVGLRFRSRQTTGATGIKFESSPISGNPYRASSGTQVHADFSNPVGQSGTAGYTMLKCNVTETSTGSGTKRLMELQVGTADRFSVSNTGVVNAHAGQIVASNVVTLTPSGTTQTIDFNTGNFKILDLGSASGNVTVTLSNMLAGGRYVIKVVQGAGARNVTFTAVQWPAATAPTITVTNGAIDMIYIDYDGSTAFGRFSQAMG